MGIFRPRRTGHAGQWLEWKVRVFATGAVLGLAGIFLNQRRLVWAALAVLAVGLVLRVLPGQDAGAEAPDPAVNPPADGPEEGVPGAGEAPAAAEPHRDPPD